MTPPLFQLLYAPMYQAPRLSPAGSPAARGPRALRRNATDGTTGPPRSARRAFFYFRTLIVMRISSWSVQTSL